MMANIGEGGATISLWSDQSQSSRDIMPMSHKKRKKKPRPNRSRYGSRLTRKQPTIDEESIFSLPSISTQQHTGHSQQVPVGEADEVKTYNSTSSSSTTSTSNSSKYYHSRNSSRSVDSAHDRIRRYIYAAISSTFFFVVFRDIGVIDQVHRSALFAVSDAPTEISTLRHRRESVSGDGGNGGGALVSLAATAASMAATSMTVHDSLMEEDERAQKEKKHLLLQGHTYVSRAEMMEHVTLLDKTIVSGSRPIMYTFFEWIPPRNRGTQMSDVADKALIAEWKAAWKAAGWEPRVLTLEDAKKHPQYNDYAPTLNSIPMLGVDGLGGNVVYNQLCFLRWLAMAAVGGGYMCDYDVFPVSRAPKSMDPPDNGNFTVYCKIKGSSRAGIPCLMSGNAPEWTRMAYALLENGLKNAKGESMWSDMLAMIDMRNDKTYKINDAVLEGQDVLLKHGWTPNDCGITAHKKAIHFSHEAMRLGFLNPGESAEDRPDIIRRFLRHWHQACGDSEILGSN